MNGFTEKRRKGKQILNVSNLFIFLHRQISIKPTGLIIAPSYTTPIPIMSTTVTPSTSTVRIMLDAIMSEIALDCYTHNICRLTLPWYTLHTTYNMHIVFISVIFKGIHQCPIVTCMIKVKCSFPNTVMIISIIQQNMFWLIIYTKSASNCKCCNVQYIAMAKVFVKKTMHLYGSLV